MKRYMIIKDDDRLGVLYLVRVGLGLFWESTTTRDDARVFTRRSDAAKELQRGGRFGRTSVWRIVPV